MGTHSTIHIYTKNGRNLINIYNQYDGYYQGVGKEIYEWWSNKDNYGNGFDDTAFLFIAKWKGDRPYNRYLTTERDEQEYNYYIYEDEEVGVRFSIRKEKWFDKEMEFGSKWMLNYGTLEEFLKELNTEVE